MSRGKNLNSQNNTYLNNPIVVLISASQEWQAVVGYYHPTKLQTTPYGDCFHLELSSGEELVFLHGGWGKIKAAGSTQYAISRWKPKQIINLGTCGGFAGQVELNEVILAEKTIVYDLIEQMLDPDLAIRAYSTELDLTFLREPYPQLVSKTLLVSGDRDLVAGEIPELMRKYGAVAGDWESGAIAFIAKANGMPCLILRGVSDLVGNEGGEVYDNIDLFAERAKGVMENLLRHLPAWVEQCR
jgi:adenosylhomocysteine nucleosidase